VKLLVVEDQPLFRSGLKRILEDDSEIEVIALADSAEMALENLTGVDVVLTDLSLPLRDGLWLVAHLARSRPDLPVLVITLHREPTMVRSVMEAGARGYVLKTAEPTQLREAVCAVADGKRYIQSGLILSEVTSGPRLSIAEIEILQLASRGLDLREVRSRLKMSPPSFRSRERSICRKLEADGIAQAIVKARAQSILVSEKHTRST
jgi:DNA-binding NarL/FixJ family response regulator